METVSQKRYQNQIWASKEETIKGVKELVIVNEAKKIKRKKMKAKKNGK